MKLYTSIFIVFTLGLFIQKAPAQDTISLVEYPLKKVSISPLMLSKGPSVYFYQLGTGGNLEPVGYRGKNLAEFLKKYPVSHSRYRKSRADGVIGTCLTIVGTISFLTMLHTGTEEFRRDHGDNPMITGGVIGVGAWLSAELFHRLSQKNYKKAVRYYNDALLGRR